MSAGRNFEKIIFFNYLTTFNGHFPDASHEEIVTRN